MSRLLLFLFCICALQGFTQPSTTDGLLKKGLYLGYVASPDHSQVAFYEPDGNGYNYAILNLKDFSLRRMPMLNILAKPTPDMKGQYWIQTLKNYNYDTAAPNFKLHYSPDGTAEKEKVYEGPWHPFGFTKDGKAVAADVSYKDNYDLFSVHNLRMIDPMTGTDIKPLVAGPLLTRLEQGSVGWGGHKYFWHYSEPKNVLVRVNKQDGQTKIFRFDGKPAIEYKGAYWMHQLDDTLLLGGTGYNAGTGTGQLQAVGLMSGKKLLDTTYTMRIFAAAWEYEGGRLWAIHEGGKGITEYALTGGPLKVVKVHPLDLSAVTFYASSDPYQKLVVSRAANRVLLFPRWDNYGIPTNDGYIWELSTGKLLHKISNFYKEATYKAAAPPFNRDAAIAQAKAYEQQVAAEAAAKAAAGPCGDAKAALRVKVGAHVRQGRDGQIYQLTDYDCKAFRYSARAVQGGGNGYTASIPVWEVSPTDGTTPKYSTISTRSCDKCNGSGRITGTRNYEKVDKGIYNKYTTTGTVNYNEACKACNGSGVVGY